MYRFICSLSDNSILTALQDYSNPLTAPLLERYAVKPSGNISEVYHARKWHERMPLDILSPMYDDRHRKQHFYVNELARMKDGSYVIPLRWVTYEGRLHADALRVIIEVYQYAGTTVS